MRMCRALYSEPEIRQRKCRGCCARTAAILVLAEGASMRLTVRSDYDSFITSHNDKIEELLSTLRRQA
jgi:hypothetical protein